MRHCRFNNCPVSLPSISLALRKSLARRAGTSQRPCLLPHIKRFQSTTQTLIPRPICWTGRATSSQAHLKVFAETSSAWSLHVRTSWIRTFIFLLNLCCYYALLVLLVLPIPSVTFCSNQIVAFSNLTVRNWFTFLHSIELIPQPHHSLFNICLLHSLPPRTNTLLVSQLSLYINVTWHGGAPD